MISDDPKRCRWIDGDPRGPTGRQCPERVAPGRSYCSAHMRRAYKPAVPRVVGELDVATYGKEVRAIPDPFA